MYDKPSDFTMDWAFADEDHVAEAIFNIIQEYGDGKGIRTPINTARGMATYLGRYNYLNSRNWGLQDTVNEGYFGHSKINFNVTAACIDTLTAKLASMPVIIQACTNRGTAKGRQLAQDLNFLIKGVYHKYEIENLVTMAFRDAMINKAGFIKVGFDDDEFFVERIPTDDVFIDVIDGIYAKPHKIVHQRAIPRHAILMRYPHLEDKINSVESVNKMQQSIPSDTVSIAVVEGWCKNTYRKKGRHVICIKDCVLVDEEWDKDYLPIVQVDYNPPVLGPYGQSLVDELDPLQNELNRLLTLQQIILRNISIPRVFLDTNSRVNKNNFTNKPGIILEGDFKNGIPPIIHNGAAMPPELPAQIQFLIAQSYARAGLTSTDTQGVQPQGLESGEALKTLTEIKSERWAFFKSLYEKSHLNLADVILKELSQVNMKLPVVDKSLGLREVSTKSIPKKIDQFVLQLFPISTLPSDISGRIDTIDRLRQMGVIQPQAMAGLLDIPDLAAEQYVSQAPVQYVQLSIEKMIATGEYIAPEPYTFPQYGLQFATAHYSLEKMNGNNEETLKLLRKYIDDCNKLIAMLQVQQPGSPQLQQPLQAGQQSAQPGQQQPIQSQPMQQGASQ